MNSLYVFAIEFCIQKQKFHSKIQSKILTNKIEFLKRIHFGWMASLCAYMCVCAKVIFRYYSCLKSKVISHKTILPFWRHVFSLEIFVFTFWFRFLVSIRISAHRFTNKPMNALKKIKWNKNQGNPNDNPKIYIFIYSFQSIANIDNGRWFRRCCGGCCIIVQSAIKSNKLCVRNWTIDKMHIFRISCENLTGECNNNNNNLKKKINWEKKKFWKSHYFQVHCFESCMKQKIL